jgi:hypothetical protein
VKKGFETLEGDEKTGSAIILRSLEEPLRQLAYNAGLEGSVVVNQVRSAKKGQGLNVDTGEIEDLVKAGIIDPTMVTRSALQNAASIAKNILTTEAIVAEAPEKGLGGAACPTRAEHGRYDVGPVGEPTWFPHEPLLRAAHDRGGGRAMRSSPRTPAEPALAARSSRRLRAQASGRGSRESLR